MGRPRGRRRVRVRGQPRGTSTQALSFRQGLLSSLGGHRPSRPGDKKKPGREGGKEHRGSESLVCHKPSFRESTVPEARFPRRTLLGFSLNRKSNPQHSLTALLFGVMVTVVGWARDYYPPPIQSPA